MEVARIYFYRSEKLCSDHFSYSSVLHKCDLTSFYQTLEGTLIASVWIVSGTTLTKNFAGAKLTKVIGVVTQWVIDI